MNRSIRILFLFLLICNFSGHPRSVAAVSASGVSTLLPVPVPVSVDGIDSCEISLNGIWQINLTPPDRFWFNETDSLDWQDIQVPGECVMQGFAIKQDVEFAYKKQFLIPDDFKNKTIVIRFEGVYSYARIWLNGKFIRDHHGGFTAWDCDVTDYIKPGDTGTLIVGVTDRADDISYGSAYAKHNIGGILRDAKLLALPRNYVSLLNVETDLDHTYRNGTLNVNVAMFFVDAKNADLKFTLRDPDDRVVPVQTSRVAISVQSPTGTVAIPVSNVQTWDAEHPNLYSLDVAVIVNSKRAELLSYQLGFRKIERRGSALHINGHPIKLRGINRHSIHPLTGRTVPEKLQEKDVLLAKEANINFIRTAHYPPTEALLDYCDRYGIYVGEETAVCFVDVNAPATQDSLTFRARYLSQLQEMVAAHRNHPSVIMWSLGNESVYGTNIQAGYDWLAANDTTRPVIWSYLATVPDSVDCSDIISVHYPYFDKISQPLTSLYDPGIGKNKTYKNTGLPILYDEWAHVACYNTATLRRDPNVRNFWGESLERFWTTCFRTEGRLGGLIWCMIDEFFQIPKSAFADSERAEPAGYGGWGIVDGWRRKKPEFWHTKKAYSPVKITAGDTVLLTGEKTIRIPVENRFDHTNLNEITINWRTANDSGTIRDFNLKPHDKSILSIKSPDLENGQYIELEIFDQYERLIDAYSLSLGGVNASKPGVQAKPLPVAKVVAPAISETDTSFVIASPSFQLKLNKTTGLISSGRYQNTLVIKDGPYIQLDNLEPRQWQLQELDVAREDEQVVVLINGKYDSVAVALTLTIDGFGRLTIQYAIANPPKPPESEMEWFPGYGFREVGVFLVCTGDIDQLNWQRKGLWSVYPKNHIGRNSGTAIRCRSIGLEAYRSKPVWAWQQDMKSFSLNGPNHPGYGATHDFRGLKEYIRYASALISDSAVGLLVESDGSDAVRLEPVGPQCDDDVRFMVINLWNYRDLGWGNYMKPPVYIKPGFSRKASIRFLKQNNKD